MLDSTSGDPSSNCSHLVSITEEHCCIAFNLELGGRTTIADVKGRAKVVRTPALKSTTVIPILRICVNKRTLVLTSELQILG